ncbi:MAG TPA: cytochrome c maturation protein CcmE [Gemmatimonadales bacterium]|jgi:cytochrome c-type biogenesis protein CcmE
MKRRTGSLVFGGVVILGVFAYLAWGAVGSNVVYFLTPGELLARTPEARGVAVRLGGMVEQGSVRWDAERRELRFRLQDGTHAVEVLSVGAPPQMFAEGMGAVVEGVFTDGVFRSHNVMVKHSNEYRAPQAGEQPAEYYRQLFRTQSR